MKNTTFSWFSTTITVCWKSSYIITWKGDNDNGCDNDNKQGRSQKNAIQFYIINFSINYDCN